MKLSRQTLFAAVLVSLAVYVSCKGTIKGDFPEYNPPPPDDTDLGIIVEEPDTASMKAEDITVTAGNMTSEAADNFSSTLSQVNSPADSASLADVATQVNNSVNASQRNYWQGQDENSIEAGIESDNATMVQRTNQAKSILEANPGLAAYVPSVQSPSGRILTNGRVLDSEETEAEDFGGFRTNVDEACLSYWGEWRTTKLAELRTGRDAALAAIDQAYAREKDKLDSRKSTQETTFNGSYTTRKNYFVSLWNGAKTNLQNAVNANRLAQPVADAGLILNTIVLALNVKGARDLLKDELALVSQKYTTALGNLTGTRDVLKKAVRDGFTANSKKVNDKYNAETADCGHDQGGSHDQGGN